MVTEQQQIELKEAYIWNSAVKWVYIWNTKVRPPEVSDVLSSMNRRDSFTGVYTWVKITALKTWRITKITLMYRPNTFSATLRIIDWWQYASGYPTYSNTDYSLNADNTPWYVYTLPTPYSITAGTSYVIALLSGNSVWDNNSFSGYYPVTWTAVRYDYGTISSSNSQMTSIAYNIYSITTEIYPS